MWRVVEGRNLVGAETSQPSVGIDIDITLSVLGRKLCRIRRGQGVLLAFTAFGNQALHEIRVRRHGLLGIGPMVSFSPRTWGRPA